jgi:hypothetical protein
MLHTVDFASITSRVSNALQNAAAGGELSRDREACELWHDVYPRLSGERFGLFGAVTSRAEANTLRLSCIYALLDETFVVGARHLAAALEVWYFCENSCAFIFGNSTGNPTADTILAKLKQSTNGVTRSELSELFSRNRSSVDLNEALRLLQTAGLATQTAEPTVGRPTERWWAA